MKKEIEQGLKKAKHIEELEKTLRSVEELEREDEEFHKAVKHLQNLIKKKTIK